jgi:hypothetical protein
MTTAHGLRIACLGGIYDPAIYSSAEAPPVRFHIYPSLIRSLMLCSQGFASPFFSTHTTEKLLSNTLSKSVPSSSKGYNSLAAIRSAASDSQLVDILISNAWPSAIADLSSVPLPSPELASIGAPPLDDIVRHTKPRYHFSAGGGQPPKFWEREPFVWDNEGGRLTRFVSLGAFGGEPTPGKKQRVCSVNVRLVQQ